MAAPIRTWSALYNVLGYPEPDDPELTRTIIITYFIASHQDQVFASETYFVRIPLHFHRSSETVPHLMEVMSRLRTIISPQAMVSISVEVLHTPARHIR